MMGSFALIDNLLKDGLTTWVPDILKQRYTLGDSLSILFTVLLPILGVFGGIISISVVNVMKDFIAVISLFFAIGAVSIGAIAVMPGMPVAVAVIFFGIVVCVMHGVNNIVNTTGPLKMRDKLDAGKMAGIMNGCAYVGSTISSYGLGKVADIGGWQTVLYLLLLICIISVIAGVIYCAAERIKKK